MSNMATTNLLPSIFVETRRDRFAKCNKPTTCGQKNFFRCHRCRRLSKKLCRAYHEEDDPRKELYGRLLYEYVFDYIQEDALLTGMWAEDREEDVRDQGHVFRLRKLTAITGMFRVNDV
jgi:hypothetical protein